MHAAHCSLREAVSAANAAPGESVIRLESGNYLLQKANPDPGLNWPVEEDANAIGDFDVHGRVSLIGKGVGVTRLDGQGLDRLFHVHAGAQVKLRGLTLTGGRQIYDRGAVLNRGQLHLYQVELVGNRVAVYMPYPAALAGNGGAIANFGVLEVQRTTFRDNRNAGEEARARAWAGSALHEGAITVRDSLFSANWASDYSEMGMGGALYNRARRTSPAPPSRATRCCAAAGSAIANAGWMRLANSTLSGNRSIEAWRLREWPPLAHGDVRAVTRRAGPRHHRRQRRLGLTNRGDVLLRNSLIAGNRSSEFEDVRNCRNQPGAVDLRVRGLLLARTAATASRKPTSPTRRPSPATCSRCRTTTAPWCTR